uniref:Uncharacterized protein n=1 Tax=Anopheles coluzzii TaxID=1518534 RepID=A0A6E8VAY2_ANOCL
MAKATAVRVSTGKKFSQLLIITPAVAIDSNEHDDYHGPFNSSSLDSGCGGSSEGSLSDDLLEEDEQRRQRRRQQGAGDRRNNNDTVHQLPPLLGGGGGGEGGGRRDGGGTTSSQGSWRWCGLICSAVKCFRAAAATTASRRSQQGRPSPRQPLAGTAVRYTTTSEGVWGQVVVVALPVDRERPGSATTMCTSTPSRAIIIRSAASVDRMAEGWLQLRFQVPAVLVVALPRYRPTRPPCRCWPKRAHWPTMTISTTTTTTVQRTTTETF